VVDDDPGILEMLSEVVSRKGFKVVTVASGEQALEQLDKQHFDLIFLDLVLPGMSGAEALQAIKEKDKRAVVVIVTGYGDDPIAMDAMSLGPLFLIRKPFRVSDIVEVLNAVVKVR
jgi:DNA-binding NtrC family response regulator